MITVSAPAAALGLAANPISANPRSLASRCPTPVSSSFAPGFELENRHSTPAASPFRTGPGSSSSTGVPYVGSTMRNALLLSESDRGQAGGQAISGRGDQVVGCADPHVTGQGYPGRPQRHAVQQRVPR